MRFLMNRKEREEILMGLHNLQTTSSPTDDFYVAVIINGIDKKMPAHVFEESLRLARKRHINKLKVGIAESRTSIQDAEKKIAELEMMGKAKETTL